MQNKSFAEMRKIAGINQISQLCNHAASMVGSDAQKKFLVVEPLNCWEALNRHILY